MVSGGLRLNNPMYTQNEANNEYYFDCLDNLEKKVNVVLSSGKH